jgi:hypothetical protein
MVSPELDYNIMLPSSHVIARPHQFLDCMRQHHISLAVALVKVAVFSSYIFLGFTLLFVISLLV